MAPPPRLLILVLLLLLGFALVRPYGSDAKLNSTPLKQKTVTNSHLTQTPHAELLRPAPQSDSLWTELNPDSRFIARRNASGLKHYRALTLNNQLLKKILEAAPLTAGAHDPLERVMLSLPLPDGSLTRFLIEEAPIMEEGLRTRFPEIKTYRAFGVDDRTATSRFDLMPSGFHAIIISARGTSLIEPDQQGEGSEYVAYSQNEMPTDAMICDVDGPSQDLAIERMNKLLGSRSIEPLVSNGSVLKTYRLAVAATAEYTAFYGGGTAAGGLAAVTTTINLVDAIYERELSIRLVLVANEDQIIFTNTATDGYTSDNENALFSQNQGRIDSVIGSANYDIGHVLDGRNFSGFQWEGLGDIGSVCVNGRKAKGVDILRNILPSNLYAYYSVAHEMGHQFGATHTFNATTGFCGGQREASTAYEPGTGSTIMGYRLNCGSEDLNSVDTYFHNASLEQIVAYTSSTGSCAITSQTANHVPFVQAPQIYTIPMLTPFVLTAIGNDPDDDSLTYTWEEFDLGTAAPPSTDDGSRPIMRSYAPTTDPSRVFPKGANSGANAVPFDLLASTTRTMNFRVTARDNEGAVASAATQVNVTTAAGNFNVIDFGGITAGSTRTLGWNVRNTDQPPVSCTDVRISLSLDNGATYPIVLANSTPNDGHEDVTIPGLKAPNARIRVEAIGNIFFNVSPAFLINGTENAAPTIDWFAPSSTNSGSTVKIRGFNFITPTAVRFNGIDAQFTVNSTTEITATVPAGNIAGPITVTTPYGLATSSSAFGTTPNYIVAGRVLDSANNPIADVTLNVEAVYQGLTTYANAFSDASGNYLSANLGCQTSVKVTPFKFGYSFNPINTTFSYPFCVSGKGTVDFSASQNGANTIQLAQQNFDTNEFQSNVAITITRTGQTSGSAGVDYQTSDTDNFTVPCNDKVNNLGSAFARCDYATSRGTVIFDTGETSKTIFIPIINDSFAESVERFSISISNARGATLGTTTTSTVIIADNDAVDGPNPIVNTPFFVRQNYLDFLSREPEVGEPWSALLNNCSDVNNNPACDRLTVSAAFFGSQEFQLKGFFVYRFYKLAFNRLPTYAEIVADMSAVTGQTPNEVFQRKAQFTDSFVARTEFTNTFGNSTNAQYVSAFMNGYGLSQVTTPDPAFPNGTTKVSLTTADLANQLTAGTLTRAQVLRAIADSDQVFSAEYNAAFVAMQYYGYLRRTPETTGYNAWLNFLNAHPADSRAMVDGFMNSNEYRLRFGP